MKPPFIPLIRPFVGADELKEVRRVLESGWLAQGPKVKEFEKGVARFLGARHVVATSSCTTALSLALEALKVGRQTETVVPDFTFPATANVVIRAGGVATLADVDPETFALQPAEAKKSFGPKTRALIPVHPFGHPFPLDEVGELADGKGLDVVEDAATAFGTRYRGRFVGSRGRAVCFSFHPRKLLTTGEGGCLVTDDPEVFERAEALRNHGQVDRGGRAKFVLNGLNYRMSDVQAAIGVAQLRKIRGIIATRRKQAEVYRELLGALRVDARPPVEKEWAHHTYQSFVVVLGPSFRSRDSCIRLLRQRHQIEAQLGTYSLSSQQAFRSCPRRGSLATSQNLYERSLTLPMYQGLTEEEQAYVVDALARVGRG